MRHSLRTFALTVVLCLMAHSAWAGNTCVFVADGTTRAWSATTSWTGCGGVAPTAVDDVTFSTNTASSVLTIDGTSGSPNLAKSLNTTNYTRTITMAAGKQLNLGDPAGSGAGSLVLTAGMTFAPSSTSLLKFVGTTGTMNITTAAYRVGPWTFDGVSGGWQFQDAVDPTSGSTFTLTNGALDTNGKAVGATSGVDFNSNNSNTRSLTLGATNWKTGGSNLTIWNITTATGMTLSAASSTITWTTASGDLTFAGGGLTYGTLTDSSPSTNLHTISGANTFGTLTSTLTSGGGGSLQAFVLAANQTVTGTFTINGFSATARNFIQSNTRGTAITITAATVVTTYTDFQDITAAGAASWNLSAATGGSGNCGGNTGITFTTPVTAYLKTAVSINWNAASWFTTSGGSTPITNSPPLPQDTAIIDANSVTAGGKTITLSLLSSRLPAMNWTGVLNSPVLAMDASGNHWSFYGNVTFAAAMTVSGTATPVVFEGRGAQTITTAGVTWTEPVTVDSAAGTWTQSDNFTSNRNATTAMLLTSGTWLTGTNTLTLSGATAKLNVAGGTLTSAGGTVSLTGASSANITVASGTLNALTGTVSMTGAGSTLTLSGGTFQVGTLTRTGFACTLAGTAMTVGTSTDCTTWAINSGTLASPAGTSMAFVAGAITVTNKASCSFGDAGMWPSWMAVNDNVRRRKAA